MVLPLRVPASILALLGLGLCGCAASSPPGDAGPSRTPNIVFVLADDMGYGDPKCNNPESRIETPNIDRLAVEGMRFTDAHAPGSWCVPSRYGLLTGRYPLRTRMNSGKRALIGEGQVTIASLLHDQGYSTGMVGKWHLGFRGGAPKAWANPLRGGPVDCGFDSYFGIPSSLDIPPYYYIRDRQPVAPPTETIAAKNTEGWTKIQGEFWRKGGIAPGFVHEDVLPKCGEEAVQFIDRCVAVDESKRFFLYVALPAPHTPWLPSSEFRGKSGASMYGDFVMQVDDTVGKILAALDRNGVAKDTIVVFTSDNGPVWYPHDVERFSHRSVGPLRGMKSDGWEGGHRMPFLARWPGRVSPGTVCDQTICFTDMLATFAAIVSKPDTRPDLGVVDSVSILPLLEGGREPVREVTVLRANASVIREGKWKLITHLGSGGFSKPRRIAPEAGGPTGQLYDLEADLGETTNLWADKPEVVARLLAKLRQIKG